MKTSELTGVALDWAVAKSGFIKGTASSLIKPEVRPYSTDWAQGGPIIERESIGIYRDMRYAESIWVGQMPFNQNHSGPTPLIAAMRCFVASKLGDEVEIPEELMEQA